MARASKRPGPVQPEELLRKMLTAQAEENYDDFASSGTAHFREKLTKAIFFASCERISRHLAGGYEIEFFIELAQAHRTLYVWKLTYSDGSGQALVQLWLTPDEKISGILLHPGREPEIQAEAA
jgi:hypothetical protein